MMRGSRGYIRGGRGGSSYRGHPTTSYRGNSGSGHSPYNSNFGANRDHSAGGDGMGGSRFSGPMNESRGRGGFDHSFNSNHSMSSSMRYSGGPPVNRYQVNNQPQDGGYNKRPYPGNSAHNSSSRDRSPDRKRNRAETSRRNDDYGNSSYISGGGGGGNSYNNRYDGNNDGGGGGSGGFQPNRRYEPVNSRGGSSSQVRSNAYQRSNNNNSFTDDASVSRGVRNDRYETHSQQQQQHHHHQPQSHHHQPNHHSGSSQFSPPVRRPYLGRGAPSNRITSTTTYRGGRGSATTYGRGTSIRRPYGSTMQVRSSATGYGLSSQRTYHATGLTGGGGGGGGSYVRRTTTTATSEPFRRKVLVPRVSTAGELARKLKIANLRSMIKKNNEKIGKAAAGASDSDTVSSKPKNDTKPELDDEDDEDEDAAEQPIDMEHDETADVATADAETVDKDGIPAPPKIKKSVAAKPVKTVKKVAKPLAVAADGEHDADELQLDNDEDVDGLDQDIDNDDEDDEDDVDDCDDQPEYAVQKRTYIKLDCVHCCRSYYTIKSYNYHLYGSQHKNALFQSAQRQRTQMNRIRVLQRRVQRNLEYAQETDMDGEDAVSMLGAPQFCQLCRLNYRTDKIEHQQSKEHRQIKRLMKPSCRTCQVGFESPMDYEVHRSSLVHLKADAEANSNELQDSVDVNWGEFQTVDSIGDVDDAELLLLKNAEDAAAADDSVDKKQRKDSEATVDGDSSSGRKTRNGNTDANANKEEPPVNIGVEMIREMQVMYCDLCRTTLTQRTDPEVTLRNHCRWRTHIKLYNQYIETKARSEARKLKKQQQLEQIEKQRRKIEPTNTVGTKTKKATALADASTIDEVVETTTDTVVKAESTKEPGDVEQTISETPGNDEVVGAVAATSAVDNLEMDIAAAEAAGGDEEEEEEAAGTVVVEDKDLVTQILQAVSSANPNDDEDEDSTTTTERYDRFKNSEHDCEQSNTKSMKIAATAPTTDSAGSNKTKI